MADRKQLCLEVSLNHFATPQFNTIGPQRWRGLSRGKRRAKSLARISSCRHSQPGLPIVKTSFSDTARSCSLSVDIWRATLDSSDGADWLYPLTN